MAQLNFVKVEGAGNDYVLVDAFDPRVAAIVERDPASLSRAMSDRHLGIGSDGLLIVGPSDAPAAARMRMFNADGSEGRMCGNGLRCVVRYLAERGRADAGVVDVETLAGRRRGRLLDDGEVELTMGVPDFRPEAVPVLDALRGEGDLVGVPVSPDLGADPDLGLCVSVGNPHVVVRVAAPERVDLARYGHAVEHSPRLPEGANVHFVQPTAPDRWRARTWERGSGETRACGTGAVAVAVVARRTGWSAGPSIDVDMPGGRLRVGWNGRDAATLAGPARMVFCGEWSLPS